MGGVFSSVATFTSTIAAGEAIQKSIKSHEADEQQDEHPENQTADAPEKQRREKKADR